MGPDETNDKSFKEFMAWSPKKAPKSIGAILKLPRSLTSFLGQSINLSKRYPAIASAEYLAKKHQHHPTIASKTLDLGCGEHPRNPFGAELVFGVDIRKDLEKGIKYADLSSDPIPFESNIFDFCTAYDVIEHIPR